MENLKIAIGDGFLESFARIPKAKQKKVMEFVAKFRYNPTANGINYEKINDVRDQNFRSVRIDQDYRGIILKPAQGNVYILLWVDKHDDAYDWARSHRCHIHPQTGTLQLVEIVQSDQPEIERSQVPATANTTPRLFDLSDDTLLSLGVPAEDLPRIKDLTCVEDLESIEKTLPIEAFEALYLLAAGTPLDDILLDYASKTAAKDVNTEDFAEALNQDASRRRFYVVGDEMELLEMLEAPLEKWRVFLHPSQRRLIARHWSGPVRVLGGAGTGKTVVAMHRAKWLASQLTGPSERILFTTFTSNLAVDIQENLRKICSTQEFQRIDVQHIDAWVVNCLKRLEYNLRVVYPNGKDSEYEQCWSLAEGLINPSLGLTPSFFREEWERVILPQSIRSRHAYLTASRIGRGVPLTRKQRADSWPVFEEMRIQLTQRKLTTIEDAAFDIIAILDSDSHIKRYRSIVVDEGQDFGPEMLVLLRRLVPENEDDLFIVGDGHQRIYHRKAVLGKCGINIRGRGKKLRINYRTTEEIRRFATRILEGIPIDDMDDSLDSLMDYRSLMHGDYPDVHHFSSISDESKWIGEKIESLISSGMLSQDICLVARTNHLLDEFQLQLQSMGIEIRKLSRQAPDNRNLPGIRLATMHRVKGLEFKAVFMVAINDGIVPLNLGTVTKDLTETTLRNQSEKALFHVAATRAIKYLSISSHGKASRYLVLER
ncbi:3'-5' exonuclease [Methylotuvimicrobium sp. KM1]|uniref:3'-5' exonuclease n=1 Tax=Methylotuvimicrobium sp. KM1 TaxID=3377707 RepID=UPI00384FF26B